jgi:phospholipid-translocating ATPase
LIKDYSTVVILDHETGEVEQRIGAAILDINDIRIAHCVVVVDGQTLSMIEATPSIEALFFELTVLADSVICSRASPSQKASLVKAIRKRVNGSVTLAIGDGANDIAMIQEAHVGIGITGKEGLQAARTSDYSIAQFRFLTKLLLVQGRWNYIRVCKYTVGTFWKEMIFYLTQALYQRYNGYTGTSLYESWSISMFNTLFTSLPVIFIGVFEKDLAASTLLAVPELYTKGQKNGSFNFRIYLGWMFMAASEAIAVFFCMFSIFGKAVITKDNTLFAMGDMTYTAVVIIIWVKLQLIDMHNKSYVIAISGILCVGGWFLWNIILGAIYHDDIIYDVKGGMLYRFGRSVLWWFTLVIIIAAVVVWELAVASLRAAWFPTDVDVFQELEHDLEIKKRFEEAAAMELQQGWDRGKKKSSLEIKREEVEQAAREAQIEEMLENRPQMLPQQPDGAVEGKVKDGKTRRSLDIQELLSWRFGSIRES